MLVLSLPFTGGSIMFIDRINCNFAESTEPRLWLCKVYWVAILECYCQNHTIYQYPILSSTFSPIPQEYTNHFAIFYCVSICLYNTAYRRHDDISVDDYVEEGTSELLLLIKLSAIITCVINSCSFHFQVMSQI